MMQDLDLHSFARIAFLEDWPGVDPRGCDMQGVFLPHIALLSHGRCSTTKTKHFLNFDRMSAVYTGLNRDA